MSRSNSTSIRASSYSFSTSGEPKKYSPLVFGVHYTNSFRIASENRLIIKLNLSWVLLCFGPAIHPSICIHPSIFDSVRCSVVADVIIAGMRASTKRAAKNSGLLHSFGCQSASSSSVLN